MRAAYKLGERVLFSSTRRNKALARLWIGFEIVVQWIAHALEGAVHFVRTGGIGHTVLFLFYIVVFLIFCVLRSIWNWRPFHRRHK
jgi:hypothetical protein